MKKLLLVNLFSLFLLNITINAQTINWRWAKKLVYGDIINSNNRAIRFECIDNSGNVYISGVSLSSGTVTADATTIPSPSGKKGLFIAKFDSTGVLIWEKHGFCTNSSATDPMGVNGICTDNNGNLYISYHFTDTLKYDGTNIIEPHSDNYSSLNYLSLNANSGALNFNKQLESDIANSGSLPQNKIITTRNVLMDVNTTNELVFVYTISANFIDSLSIRKFDNTGAQTLRKLYDCPNANLNYKRLSVKGPNIVISAQTLNTFSIGTYTLSTPLGQDFIARFDNSGNINWTAQGKSKDYFQSNIFYGIHEDTNGDIYFTGGYYDSLKLTGASQTYKSLGKTTTFADEFFYGKYDASGALIWYQQGWGERSNWGNSIKIGADNNLYVMGNINKKLFRLGGDSVIAEASGNTDAGIIAQINKTNGSVQWIRRINNVGGLTEPGDEARQINLFFDALNNIYYSASFANFGTTVGGVAMTSTQGNCFFAKSGEKAIPNNPTGIKESEKTAFLIFPNPTNAEITIHATGKVTKATIMNQIGEKVFEVILNENTPSINIEHLTKGIYFLEIKTEYGTSVQKLLKQ